MPQIKQWFDIRIWPTLFGFIAFGIVVAYLRQTALMAPVDLYLIAWHESMHAVGAWLTGGSVHSMEVHARNGVTWTSGGWFPVISMAGYVGTSLWGAALLVTARRPAWIWPMHLLTVALPPLVMLFGNGISLSLLAILAISVGLFFLWRKFPGPVTLLVSALFASESWRDVQMYLFSIPGRTDAGILARYMGVQLLTLPIALCMAVLSLLIWWTAFRHGHIKLPNARPGPVPARR
ncbi:M50 family metallopeptidase [Massilia sp. TSP1-1-2]|uniref:M50 family metallopeptidase n=1 Tax=unclassified Massilia TaxID=2609279 RepID=UPI003CFAA630